MKKQMQKGFTLIELIVVIVILGILAAVAMPRFVNFGTDARVASLNGLRGAVESASMLAHSRFLANGSTGTTVDMEGTKVDIVNGYPAATDTGIKAALRLSDGYTATSASGVTTFAVRSNCSFTYTAATTTAAPEFSTSIVSGC